MKKKSRSRTSISAPANAVLIVLFSLMMVMCICPVLLVLGISFSDERDVLINGYSMIPQHFTTDAYRFIFKWSGTILNSYGVTLLVTVVGTVCSTFLVALFAYPLSRREFSFRKQFSFFALFTMLFNGGMVPWYIVCVKFLHLNNTIFALIVPYLMNAFYVMIMRTFYQTTIPDAIVESARIDGCGDFRIFRTIVLPLALPGLATIGLFNTLAFWNDYYLPLMLVTDQNLYNLQYMLYKLLVSLSILEQIPSTSFSMEAMKLPGETARMAMCILSIGPIIIAYPFFQKYFIKGLTIGSVKG